MHNEETVVSQKFIPGITPDSIISAIKQLPIVHQHWKLNTEANQKYLIDSFMRLPSSSDCPGYIYGFREKQGYNSSDQKYWIKMGRTNRATPQTRILEWQKTDKHEYIQIFTVRSQHNKKLELLVHLVFAYARKIRQINGERRVQWFTFDRKVPTAAITNFVNMLMEKVHEKFIFKIQEDESVKESPFYKNFVKSLVDKYKIKESGFNYIFFGLPKTGKSQIGRLFAKEVEKKIQSNGKQLKKNVEVEKQLEYPLEISDFDNFKHSEEALQYYFSTWERLSHTKKIVPVLVVKQSDLESSKLIGLTEALKIVQKYTNLNQIFIIITFAEKTFTVEKAKQNVSKNREFLSKHQINLIEASEYYIIPKNEKGDLQMSKKEEQDLKDSLDLWSIVLEKQKKNSQTIDVKIQPKYYPECHEIIERAYQDLPQILAEKYKNVYNQHLDEDLQIQYIIDTRNILNQIAHEKNQNQKTIHNSYIQLSQKLQLPEALKIQLLLYAFCEITINKNMKYSTMLSQVSDQVNEKIINIKDKEIGILQKILGTFKIVIAKYKRGGKEKLIPLLVKVYDLTKMDDMIEIFEEIIKVNSNHMDEESKQVSIMTQKLIICLKQIKDLMQKGFRLDATFGKVRSSIYEGLKNEKQMVLQTNFLIKEEPKTHESTPKSTSSPPKIEVTHQAISIYKQLKQKSIGMLQGSIKSFPEGKSILNIVKEFSFQSPPKIQHISHNIFIIAKQIKVYDDCTLSFQGMTDEKGQKRKHNFIMLADQYINLPKLTIPTQSPNGFCYVLTEKDGKITQLHHPTNDKSDKRPAFETLLRLYHFHHKKE